MTHHYHFKTTIDRDTIDARADELGFESRSEYFRYLIRADLQHGREVDNGE